MFKFELPCDWSVNRRPNSNNSGVVANNNNSGAGSIENSSGKSKGEICTDSQLPCGKNGKNKPGVTDSKVPKPSLVDSSGSGGSTKQATSNPNSLDNAHVVNGEAKSTSGENNKSSDQSVKSKEEGINNAETSSGSIISGQILGPRSNLKLDEGFFSLESNSSAADHIMTIASDDDDSGQIKQTGKNGLPWSGQIKKLVMKHLQNAGYQREEEEARCAAASEGSGTIRQTNIRTQETYLDTESLLSKLPYKKMLSDMFGGNLRGNLQTSVIPYVTRAYEEAFMHEPTNSSERECARGKQCECMFIDRLQPFVGVEFLLPGEQAPPTPHLCVLCCRSVTQQLYYDVIFDKCEFPGTIQRFGNIHSEPGEYSLDAMLIASPTAPAHIMPLPIVSHQRNRYTVYVSSGIKRLKQSRVHFHSTPSCSADNGQ